VADFVAGELSQARRSLATRPAIAQTIAQSRLADLLACFLLLSNFGGLTGPHAAEAGFPSLGSLPPKAAPPGTQDNDDPLVHRPWRTFTELAAVRNRSTCLETSEKRGRGSGNRRRQGSSVQ
jgi:hypothetical protein